MRSAADVEIPNSGASCRGVRLVRPYVATGSTRPEAAATMAGPTGSAPSCRSAVTGLANRRGFSPVNGAVQGGSDAVITPVTARSFRP